MKRILSIDGGGIRGIIPARVIQEIEERTGKNAGDLFQLYAGTSIGGIIALGLTKEIPMSGAELVEFFEHDGPAIFPRSFWRRAVAGWGFRFAKYPSMPLESVLQKALAGDVFSRRNRWPTLITSFCTERCEPLIARSWHANELSQRESWEIARATSAAPTYFRPYKLQVNHADYYSAIDGGVYCNNPSAAALAAAVTLWPSEEFRLVSLGTGRFKRRLPFDAADGYGVIGWAKHILEIIMAGQSAHAHETMRRIPVAQYLRLDCDLPEDATDLDDASPENLRALRLAADKLIADNDEAIDKLCEELTA